MQVIKNAGRTSIMRDKRQVQIASSHSRFAYQVYGIF